MYVPKSRSELSALELALKRVQERGKAEEVMIKRKGIRIIVSPDDNLNGVAVNYYGERIKQWARHALYNRRTDKFKRMLENIKEEPFRFSSTNAWGEILLQAGLAKAVFRCVILAALLKDNKKIGKEQLDRAIEKMYLYFGGKQDEENEDLLTELAIRHLIRAWKRGNEIEEPYQEWLKDNF